MSKDDLETQCMNELFGKSEDLPYINHWRPVAYCDNNGNKIRDLTEQEKIDWIAAAKKSKDRG